jgi:hypothetical protein
VSNRQQLYIVGMATVLLMAALTSPRWNRKPRPASAPAPAVRVDTVYIERWWGYTYHQTKPDGTLILEFRPVRTKPAPAGARRK